MIEERQNSFAKRSLAWSLTMLDLFCCVIDLVNNFEKLLIKSYYWSLIKTLSEIRFFVTFNENKL